MEQREGAAPLLCSRPRAAAKGRSAGGVALAGQGPRAGASTPAAGAGARARRPRAEPVAALAWRWQLAAAWGGGAVPAAAGQGGRGEGRRSTPGGQAAQGRTAALREPARRRLAMAQRRRSAIHGGAAVVQRRRPRNRAGIGLGRERIARRSSPATQFERREAGKWNSTRGGGARRGCQWWPAVAGSIRSG